MSAEFDRHPHQADHDPQQTPGIVIGSVAAATVVVPFLIVYSFLFIARGIFVTPEQPDITSTRHGEALSGFVALIFLAFVLWGMNRMLNGLNRGIYWAGQLLTAGTAGYLLLDDSAGESQVPAVVLIASLVALALSVTPAATRWVRGGEAVSAARGRHGAPAQSPAGDSSGWDSADRAGHQAGGTAPDGIDTPAFPVGLSAPPRQG